MMRRDRGGRLDLITWSMIWLSFVRIGGIIQGLERVMVQFVVERNSRRLFSQVFRVPGMGVRVERMCVEMPERC